MDLKSAFVRWQNLETDALLLLTTIPRYSPPTNMATSQMLECRQQLTSTVTALAAETRQANANNEELKAQVTQLQAASTEERKKRKEREKAEEERRKEEERKKQQKQTPKLGDAAKALKKLLKNEGPLMLRGPSSIDEEFDRMFGAFIRTNQKPLAGSQVVEFVSKLASSLKLMSKDDSCEAVLNDPLVVSKNFRASGQLEPAACHTCPPPATRAACHGCARVPQFTRTASESSTRPSALRSISVR